AEIIVANRRLLGLTRLVRSSMSPAAKAGVPKTRSQKRVSAATLPVAARATQAATMPAAMPTPPMRGTGRAWNFCGPDVSRSSDRDPFSLVECTTHKVTPRETANAIRMPNIRCIVGAPEGQPGAPTEGPRQAAAALARSGPGGPWQQRLNSHAVMRRRSRRRQVL
ncbi:MAG: hypothetical protein ACK5QX_06730, partial [bacterium]